MANANLNVNNGIPEDECVCDRFGNNKLHKELIRYTLVGNFHGITEYNCNTCKNNLPTWEDGLDAIENFLMTRDEMERMIEKRSNMLLEQNNNSQTPFQIIPELIEMLEYSSNWEYVKPTEQGFAGYLAEKLYDIKEMIKHNGGGDDDE